MAEDNRTFCVLLPFDRVSKDITFVTRYGPVGVMNGRDFIRWRQLTKKMPSIDLPNVIRLNHSYETVGSVDHPGLICHLRVWPTREYGYVPVYMKRYQFMIIEYYLYCEDTDEALVMKLRYA